MEIEEERLEVEKRCIELATQLEKAREEGEKKILENTRSSSTIQKVLIPPTAKLLLSVSYDIIYPRQLTI